MLAIYQKQFKRKREAVKVFRDGREVCSFTPLGLREYLSRTEAMYERQGGLCSICNLPMRIDEATFEHQDGRGHGGGYRDDRICIDGKWFNSAAHGMCNVRKGSVRMDRFKEEQHGEVENSGTLR